jgi:hypothetical protein
VAVYYVARSNPFYRRGIFVEDDREGFVQEVVMAPGPSGYRGVLYPLRTVREYLVEVRQRGLDKGQGGALL